MIDAPMDDASVVRAISVFGARARGVTIEEDTPELAAELRGRWDAEGHAPAAFAPDSAPGRLLRLARAGAARLPHRWQHHLRRAARLVRSRRRRS